MVVACDPWLDLSMRVFPVDERDSSWELPTPRFRVDLHGSQANATHGWTATYDVIDADVLQAIDWAQRQAKDRFTYALALVHDDKEREQHDAAHGRGLIWLVGRDGNDIPSDGELLKAQQRMLRRRHDPVIIPEGDRAPAELDVKELPNF